MLLEVLSRCPAAQPIIFNALAKSLVPAPRLKVSEWAEAYRIVSDESGSPHPGPWRNDRAPHLVEIMDALGPDDPAEDIVFAKSAQVGGSEVGLNFFGFVVSQDPGPMIMVLPSHDEGAKYVRTKLQPAIDASPSLRSRVLEMTSRTERGSTTAYKRFRGGFAQITFAGSSKGLQMLTARYTVGDEVSEWPATAGERGDPVEQLKVRTTNYESNRKRFWVSTPGVLGNCRVSADYEASDKRKRYVPCPHCGQFQVLRFERLKWDKTDWPHQSWFECAANGCVIEHIDKAEMVAAGVWIATAGDDGPGEVIAPGDLTTWSSRPLSGRVRGFHIWQAYTLFSTWDSIVAEFLKAKGKNDKLRVFTQQVLGEAWEDRGDAPDAELLHKRRVTDFNRGAPPVGPLIFTGATDVQGNRLEWAVWGWGEGLTRWLVDWGVIPGDPHDPATWAAHSQMMLARRYVPGGVGPEIEVAAWAIDTGYASPAVYNYVRGRRGVYGIDGQTGRDNRTLPMIGTPKKVDVKWNGKTVPRGALLWPVGSFSLKSDLYSSVRKTIAGPSPEGIWPPGSMILPGDVDQAYIEQLTAEHMVQVELRSGVMVRRWVKLSGRPNEALDIACYARAMAYHLKVDRMRPDQWADLRAERAALPERHQPDLFEAGQVNRPDGAAVPPVSPKTSEQQAERPAVPGAWIKPIKDWL